MMDDLLEHFLVEAHELVQQATDDLLALERDAADAARLESAFRAVHTLKGSVGLFDFPPMARVLHAGEDLLDGMRRKTILVDSATIDALLGCVSQVDRWVDGIERTGYLSERAGEEGENLAKRLQIFLQKDGKTASSGRTFDDTSWIADLLEPSGGEKSLSASEGPLVAVRYMPRPDCFFSGDDPIGLVRTLPGLVRLRIRSRDPWLPAAQMDPFVCNLMIEVLSSAPMADVKAVFRFVPDQVTFHELRDPEEIEPVDGADHFRNQGQISVPANGVSSRILRVDAKRIDLLADLLGELVIAKNALSHVAEQVRTAHNIEILAQDVLASQAAIDRLVSDMHRTVMSIRLLPMREIFRRFPQAVREISSRLGKEVEFVMEGEGVEADKAVIDGLFEPLLHVIRNAVDHGVETPHIRQSAGKEARARISLRARSEGNQVTIEVEDDGGGVEPARIRQVASERELIPGHVLDRLSDAEVLDLVFAPGFSTASEVSEVSGRGVGMDAVRVAVERLGGRVALSSRHGHGTKVRLTVPLTMTMTQIMTVRAGSDLYGIPMDAIIETTLVPRKCIMPVRDGQAFVFRNRTLPLVRLAGLLGADGAAPEDDARVLVVSVAGEFVGVAVDGFSERMDIVMRPLRGLMATIRGVTGTTLLGNGNVLMILDISELIG